MTLCPIALTVGCRKCALFSVCPLKSVIGDYQPTGENKRESPGDDSGKPPGGDKSGAS